MEPGSRGAAAKPASCREAAWLTSLDLIGQLSAGGGEYKPVHADSFRFFFLSFTFFFLFKLVYMDRFLVFPTFS